VVALENCRRLVKEAQGQRVQPQSPEEIARQHLENTLKSLGKARDAIAYHLDHSQRADDRWLEAAKALADRLGALVRDLPSDAVSRLLNPAGESTRQNRLRPGTKIGKAFADLEVLERGASEAMAVLQQDVAAPRGETIGNKDGVRVLEEIRALFEHRIGEWVRFNSGGRIPHLSESSRFNNEMTRLVSSCLSAAGRDKFATQVDLSQAELVSLVRSLTVEDIRLGCDIEGELLRAGIAPRGRS
jgi:hypothetical protein